MRKFLLFLMLLSCFDAILNNWRSHYYSSLWTDSQNWSLGRVPNSLDDVVIQSDDSVVCTVNTTVRSLTVSNISDSFYLFGNITANTISLSRIYDCNIYRIQVQTLLMDRITQMSSDAIVVMSSLNVTSSRLYASINLTSSAVAFFGNSSLTAQKSLYNFGQSNFINSQFSQYGIYNQGFLQFSGNTVCNSLTMNLLTNSSVTIQGSATLQSSTIVSSELSSISLIGSNTAFLGTTNATFQAVTMDASSQFTFTNGGYNLNGLCTNCVFSGAAAGSRIVFGTSFPANSNITLINNMIAQVPDNPNIYYSFILYSLRLQDNSQFTAPNAASLYISRLTTIGPSTLIQVATLNIISSASFDFRDRSAITVRGTTPSSTIMFLNPQNVNNVNNYTIGMNVNNFSNMTVDIGVTNVMDMRNNLYQANLLQVVSGSLWLKRLNSNNINAVISSQAILAYYELLNPNFYGTVAGDGTLAFYGAYATFNGTLSIRTLLFFGTNSYLTVYSPVSYLNYLTVTASYSSIIFMSAVSIGNLNLVQSTAIFNDYTCIINLSFSSSATIVGTPAIVYNQQSSPLCGCYNKQLVDDGRNSTVSQATPTNCTAIGSGTTGNPFITSAQSLTTRAATTRSLTTNASPVTTQTPTSQGTTQGISLVSTQGATTNSITTSDVGTSGSAATTQIQSTGIASSGSATSGSVTSGSVTSGSATSGSATSESYTSSFGQVISTLGTSLRIITTNQAITSYQSALENHSPSGSKKSGSAGVIIGASVGAFGFVALILIALILLVVIRRKRATVEPNEIVLQEVKGEFGAFTIPYTSLTFGKRIGAGAFGEVYIGEYQKSKVAIKKVLETSSVYLDPAKMEEFIEEARIMKELPPHPNVVLFRGVCLAPDPVCIVLDFCKFGSLLSLLEGREQISDERKIKLAKQIARGMLHLHNGISGKEIIHRDLAARNILLGKGGAAVSDFGMARIKEAIESASTTAQNIGPVKWMSPESLKNHQYSKKSDAFSYGVVLYEIVTREAPWKNITGVDAAHRVLGGQRMEIPDNAPQVLRSLMLQCWEEDPDERPDFEQILATLGEAKSATSSPEPERFSAQGSYDVTRPQESYQTPYETHPDVSEKNITDEKEGYQQV